MLSIILEQFTINNYHVLFHEDLTEAAYLGSVCVFECGKLQVVAGIVLACHVPRSHTGVLDVPVVGKLPTSVQSVASRVGSGLLSAHALTHGAGNVCHIISDFRVSLSCGERSRRVRPDSILDLPNRLGVRCQSRT